MTARKPDQVQRPRCGGLRGWGRGACRRWPMRGKTRCRWHGGYNRWYGGWSLVAAHRALALKQALFRAWGMPWYGPARPKTIAEVRAEMAEAEKGAGQALAVLAPQLPLADKPDAEKTPGELLIEGMTAGLILGRNICRRIDAHLAALEAAGLVPGMTDARLMNTGSSTAGWLVRAGVRVVEGEFRARRDDVFAKLLEQLAQAQAPILDGTAEKT